MNFLIQLWLELKASKSMAVLPIAVLYFLMPLLNVADILSNGEQSINAISKTVQQYLPMISIWWPILVFRQFIETNGNELL